MQIINAMNADFTTELHEVDKLLFQKKKTGKKRKVKV